MCFGLVSCAVGVDTGTDDTTGGYDAGHGTDGASNEAAGDSGSGPAETGTPFNEDAGAGEAAPPGDDGGVAESGGPPADGGTVADSCPSGRHRDDGHLRGPRRDRDSRHLRPVVAVRHRGERPRDHVRDRRDGRRALAGLHADGGLRSGSINSSNWSTGSSADPTRYYTFTVTPAAGCTVTLTSVALDVTASGTGPAHGDVATSADTFGTHTTAFAGTSNTTVTLSSVSGTGAIEVRVYGYGATGSAGTLRISQTLTVSGTIE